ncbi:Beta-phosphoglucomutase [Poriferisphaera corsica]|uniref:Beta-phosphoglucomutase n=1 Tax=Poriferisphaera corsica TaxID=2528020 RepID=A0A517YZ62_9BACT|nr:HAD family phosphatase [Poriferisphaera corsica]QDU35512.1 Beta-phosphoglucomutase [Poriferisphaera corsica]
MKAIVFDFDGVVFDSEPVHFQAFLMVSKGLGIEFDYQKYLQDFIGFDDRDAFRVMLDMIGYQGDRAEKVAELCEQKQVAFETLVKAGVAKPIDGVMNFVEQLQKADVPFAVASGATRLDIELMLDSIGMRDAFDVIVTADDVAASKPHPETYEKAVVKLAEMYPTKLLATDNCIAIEDTATGIKSARSAGLQVLGITTSNEPDLLREAHRVIDCFDEINPEILKSWFVD